MSSYRRWVRGVLFTCAMGCLSACDKQPFGPSRGDEVGGSEDGEGQFAARVIRTLVDVPEVALGDTVRVRCVVNRGGDVESDTPVNVDSVPSLGEGASSEGGYDFVPTTQGVYWLGCRTADNTLIDDKGAAVFVGTHDGGVTKDTRPCSWSVSIPSQDCHWADVGLPIDAEIHDCSGVATSSSFSVSVDGAELVQKPDGTYQLPREGDLTVVVALTGELAPNADISPVELELHVDSTAPTLALVSPARGELVVAGGLANTSVDLDGDAFDASSAITSLSIAGVPQSTGAGASQLDFSQSYDAKWGLNVIELTAQDECGNVTVVRSPFLRAGAGGVLPPFTESDVAGIIPTSVVANLGGSLFDNGLELVDGVLGRALNDLAGILDTVLQTVDLADALPQTLVDGLGLGGLLEGVLKVTLGDTVNIETPEISFVTPTPDDMDVGVQVGGDDGNDSLGVDVNISLLGLGLVKGRVVADALNLFAGMEVEQVGDELVVSICDTCLQIDATDVDLELNEGLLGGLLNVLTLGGLLGNVDDLLDQIIELVIGSVMDVVTRALENEVRMNLPVLASQFFSSMSLPANIQLPAPFNTTLALGTKLESFNLLSGSSRMALGSQVVPEQHDDGTVGTMHRARAPQDMGSLLRGGSPAALQSALGSTGFGFKDDFINRVLWAAWYGGALEIDTTESPTALGVSDTRVVATMPPVLMPGEDAFAWELGVGDLYIETVVSPESVGLPAGAPIQVTAYASVFTDVALRELNGVFTPTFDEDVRTHVQILEPLNLAQNVSLQGLIRNAARQTAHEIAEVVLAATPLPSFVVDEPGAEGTWTLHESDVVRVPDFIGMTGVLAP